MDETKNTGTNNTEGTGTDNTDNTTSKTKRGTGTGKGKGKSDIENIQVPLVEQETPKEVTVSLLDSEPVKTDKPKTKKKATKKKALSAKDKNSQIKDIQALIEGVFSVVSIKAGEHWRLSPEESKQIAEPVSNILERYDLLKKVSEISDPVALVVAATTIIAPRFIISQMDAKQKKAKVILQNGGGKVEGTIIKDNRTDGNTSTGKPTTDDGNFIKSLSNQIQEGI